MDIIPAIDLRDGKCVRLRQGKDDTATEYSADPVSVAVMWAKQGARRIHVVNLDGAFGRASGHLEVLRRIVAETGAEVQYGGGLRDSESVREALAAGATAVVLGTVALENRLLLGEILKESGSDRCIVALDTVEGKATTRGWTEVSDRDVVELALELRDAGVRQFLHTDVSRDGMMTGPDIATLSNLAGHGIDVIASGGISSVDDILNLLRLRTSHITGVIIGKALYEGQVVLAEVFAAVEKGGG